MHKLCMIKVMNKPHRTNCGGRVALWLRFTVTRCPKVTANTNYYQTRFGSRWRAARLAEWLIAWLV